MTGIPKPRHGDIAGGDCHGPAAALFDKRNFHTFQPLLYPVRHNQEHALALSTALDIEPDHPILYHEHGTPTDDPLIVATGVKHAVSGHNAEAGLS